MIVTLTGPSAAGKSTFERLMCSHPALNFTKIISCTTRMKRTGEVDGEDYYFMTDREFDQTKMVESVNFGSAKYGISEGEMRSRLDEGKIVVVVVEPNGLKQVSNWCKKNKINHIACYIGGPEETLLHRMFNRENLETERAIVAWYERATNMMDNELLWVDAFEYDWLCHSFDEDNQWHALGKLLSLIAVYHKCR